MQQLLSVAHAELGMRDTQAARGLQCQAQLFRVSHCDEHALRVRTVIRTSKCIDTNTLNTATNTLVAADSASINLEKRQLLVS